MTKLQNYDEYQEILSSARNDDDDEIEDLLSEEDVEPLEGGWGWLVAIGACMMMSVDIMLAETFGIIFSRFLSSIEASSLATAWIYNINGFFFNIMHLFTPILCDVFGIRGVAINGAVLLSMSVFLSSFVKNAWQLFCSFSLLGGIGEGLTSAVSYFIIPKYFKKRRGIAMAIMMSGNSLGVYGGSFIITSLQNKYGYRGGTLILSGICLHCLPSALVFHPVSWHSNPNSSNGSDKTTSFKDNSVAHGQKSTKSQSLRRKMKIISKKFVKSLKSNLSMMKSWKALIMAAGTAFAILGYLNFNLFIPFWLQSIGFSLDEAAWCISLSAITNFVSTIAILFASDMKCFNVTVGYISGTFILTLSSYALCFVTSRMLITVLICIFGSGMGMNLSLFSLSMIEIMGIKDYRATFGLLGLFKAFLYLNVGPIAGWIRDTNSYRASLIFLSSVTAICMVLFAFLPLAIQRERKEKQPLLPEKRPNARHYRSFSDQTNFSQIF